MKERITKISKIFAMAAFVIAMVMNLQSHFAQGLIMKTAYADETFPDGPGGDNETFEDPEPDGPIETDEEGNLKGRRVATYKAKCTGKKTTSVTTTKYFDINGKVVGTYKTWAGGVSGSVAANYATSTATTTTEEVSYTYTGTGNSCPSADTGTCEPVNPCT